MSQCDKISNLLMDHLIDEKTQDEVACNYDMTQGRVSQIVTNFRNNVLERWHTGKSLDEIKDSAEIENLTADCISYLGSFI